MTEDEAKTKWCPETRFHVASGTVYHNRLPKTDDDTGSAKQNSANCIASDCACWVWEEGPRGEEVMTKDGRQGHCGLIK